jgi:S-adenosylmethionine synthetase
MTTSYLFTSESVSAGHPDKLADQISDAILDAFLARDAQARVACEALIANGLVVVAGEFACRDDALFDELAVGVPPLVRQVLRDAGYDASFPGIDPETCEIVLRLNAQSADIRRGVDGGAVLGAGDQGLMFGYATDETSALMPLPLQLAHALVRRQGECRREGILPWLKPDAKAQVTVRYAEAQPLGVETVVLSTQHADAVPTEVIAAGVRAAIIDAVVPEALRLSGFRVLVNPTGRFVTGGPAGDVGLTGRKIIVDTYGGACPHGGGAFSGKDPTKVDRSAAYAARHVAKNLVAAGLARRCTVQLAYAIGVAEPVSLRIDDHGTGSVAPAVLEAAVRDVFDLTPAGIIAALDLARPIYRQTAAYGHFGRDDLELPWERTGAAARLQAVLSHGA